MFEESAARLLARLLDQLQIRRNDLLLHQLQILRHLGQHRILPRQTRHQIQRQRAQQLPKRMLQRDLRHHSLPLNPHHNLHHSPPPNQRLHLPCHLLQQLPSTRQPFSML